MDTRAAGLEFAFPVGGVRTIIEALAKVIEAHDGEILTCTEVASFLIENGRASGVVLASGDEVAADVVIHNGGARGLINLVGRENLSANYVERIEGLIPVDGAHVLHRRLDRSRLRPNFRTGGRYALSPRTPIEGLYLVGMDAVGSGAAGDLIPVGVRRLTESVKRETWLGLHVSRITFPSRLSSPPPPLPLDIA